MINPIVELNMLHFGSTGKIMFGIAKLARHSGFEVCTFSPYVYQRPRPLEFPNIPNHRYFGCHGENKLHRIIFRLTGLKGLLSYFGTKPFLNYCSSIRPKIIHLHNLHNCSICLASLFHYLSKNRIPVIWTLHDCWAFTGHCPHFTMVKCDKWKTGCHHCPQYRDYPKSYMDNSRWMYNLKKKWFTGVEDLTIVTPSQWLADLVKESFLKEYPVKVIHNGIDLDVFKPSPSDFREKHGIPAEKSMLLGVAFGWGKRKGLDVFVELARRLDPEKYQIVLVGTDEKTDKLLPENIISIHRTQNQAELAQIYTAADLFVNPTREEVLGLVNIEALACGTPVVTFNTGGSPECIDESCGSVVPCDDINALEREIIRICAEKPFALADCLKRAKAFDMNDRFQEYVDLYANKDCRSHE